MYWLVLLALPSLAADYYPGASDDLAPLTPAFELTGRLLAQVDDVAAIQALPGVVAVQPWRLGMVRIDLAPGVDELALSRAIKERDDVAWCHPDFRLDITSHALPNDPLIAQQWHLENTGQSGYTPNADIDVETAWALAQGDGIVVSIVDSGIDPTHPDLNVLGGYDYIDNDDDPTEVPGARGFGHGTAAAGLTAATGDNGVGVSGVVQGAEIWSGRLIGDNGTSTSDMIDAFTRSVDAGAVVINNSWGYAGCPEYTLPTAISAVFEYAETMGRDGMGTAIVFSAGNDNCDISPEGILSDERVITVAAVNGHDKREWYSCFGAPLDISAPSGGVLTTDVSGDGGYAPHRGDPNYTGGFSGTSAAAPIVSGVLALMFASNDRLTVADAREVMCDTAVRIRVDEAEYDDDGWSPWFGCGRIDAGAAVAAVANEVPWAPDLLTPSESIYEGPVTLSWQPAIDADDDALTYTVSVVIDEGEAEVSTTTATTLHLGELPAGSAVRFSVTAADTWGPGDTSDEASFTVLAIPEPPVEEEEIAGCVSAPAALGLWMGLPLLLAGRRRRA